MRLAHVFLIVPPRAGGPKYAGQAARKAARAPTPSVIPIHLTKHHPEGITPRRTS